MFFRKKNRAERPTRTSTSQSVGLLTRILVFVQISFSLGLLIGSMALASVGIYGVMAFSVNQRIGEYGIRQALGARAADIFSLVFKRGTIQVLSGIAVGALFGFVLLILLRQGINVLESHLLTYLAPTIFLAAVSAVALWMPARRAVRAQLASTLHNQ